MEGGLALKVGGEGRGRGVEGRDSRSGDELTWGGVSMVPPVLARKLEPESPESVPATRPQQSADVAAYTLQ
jgi:hypothetical protein